MTGGAGGPPPASDAVTPASEPPPVCATCGAVPADDEGVALARTTWARGVENGREVWTCGPCSRRHLRGIEGKLDSSWW